MSFGAYGMKMQVPTNTDIPMTNDLWFNIGSVLGRFLGSSTAEHPAVNRRVVGSNPTRGAILKLFEPVEGKGALGGFFLCLDLEFHHDDAVPVVEHDAARERIHHDLRRPPGATRCVP